MDKKLRRFFPVVRLAAAALAVVGTAAAAAAETYQVGPTRTYKTLADVQGLLNPGDVVEVDGDAQYPSVRFTRSGTDADPITIRGIRVNGNRPILDGNRSVNSTVQFELSNHYLLENFEITGGAFRCVFIHAAYITIRDTLVRDCPAHGILGADKDAGWLTLDRVEVTRSGFDIYDHSVYVASDTDKYPGATFRMQNSYIHDANGGNLVKSRAERNEIYYNWLEGGLWRELELIGADQSQAPDHDTPPPSRPMHSDVVGNVVIKSNTSGSSVVRIGHDSPGDWGTKGRFRFVNNIFITHLDWTVIFQAYGQLESIELHNNVFFQRRPGFGTAPVIPGTIRLLTEGTDAEWLHGTQFHGSNNWLQNGAIFVPEGSLVGTIMGDDPGFLDVHANDFRLAPGSPLIDAGTPSAPPSPAAFPFPSPLLLPEFHPPSRAIEAEATMRPVIGPIDIGVFESIVPACTYTLSPSTVPISADGGTGSLTVTTGPGCPWVAASRSTWLAVTSGANGEGSGIVTFSARQNRGPSQRNGSLRVGGQTIAVVQSPGPADGPLAEFFIDEEDLTFFGGDGPVGALTNDGVNGSLGITITGNSGWSATPRLHLPVPLDITTIAPTDRLEITVDLGEGGPPVNSLYMYFNEDWQRVVIIDGIDNLPGYQTLSVELTPFRELLGDQVNDIYMKAGASFPHDATLKLDNIRFIRP